MAAGSILRCDERVLHRVGNVVVQGVAIGVFDTIDDARQHLHDHPAR